MMRRVLIVTSTYAPSMMADMHRARQLAWELPKLGWVVEVLCPGTDYQQSICVEPDSDAFFASDTPVHRVVQDLAELFRALGFHSIGWRALRSMAHAGRKLLDERRYDLVYISTTQFPLFLLGPLWKRRFGVPFVLDFHDPCYRDDAATPAWARPSAKHALSRWLTRHIEFASVTRAAGVVVVSPDYLESLTRRYRSTGPPWLDAGRGVTIPFACLPQDLAAVQNSVLREPSGQDPPVRVVYVGVGGPIMVRAFSLICRALAAARSRGSPAANRIRIELYGTMLGWSEGDPMHLADVAKAHGVADLVHEDPRRVSYRRSLELLVGARAALVLGVDDRGYMPSKLYGYAMSGKPLLAALRRDGPAFAEFGRLPDLGHALWFDDGGDISAEQAASVLDAFLEGAVEGRTVDRRAILEPFIASSMARRHVKLFEACLSDRP